MGEIHILIATLAQAACVQDMAPREIVRLTAIIVRKVITIMTLGVRRHLELQHMHAFAFYIEVVTVHAVEHMKCSDVSCILMALAMVHVHPSPLLIQNLENRLSQDMMNMTPRIMASILCCYTKLAMRPGDNLWVVLQSYMMDKASNFTVRHLTDVLWCTATFRCYVQPGFLRKLFEEIPRVMPWADMFRVSRLLFSIGMLGKYPGCHIMQHINSFMCQRIRLKRPSMMSISHIVWGCGRVSFAMSTPVLDAIAAWLETLMHDLDPRVVARIAWGLACVSYKIDARIVNEMAIYFINNADLMDATDVSSILWSIAVFGVDSVQNIDFFTTADHLINIFLDDFSRGSTLWKLSANRSLVHSRNSRPIAV